MSTASRSNLIFFCGMIALAANWIFNSYQDFNLPGWLQFAQSTYGVFAANLMGTLSMLIFLCLMHGESQAIEGISPRAKRIFKRISLCLILLIGLTSECSF
ncbi:hypothetical protein [Inquilinus limosus]|uniref:hypothetical protein n=1 Tax=Inquilinus limosus TaxID=171674 RepID=UPI0012DBF84C|nr:hypothetical protein [Inquilinus limosus]